MAKDSKKWVAERDPTGKIHWSHPDTWRTKGRDMGETFLGAGKALFGFLVLFMLFRYFLESSVSGYVDPVIMGYPAECFDVYGNRIYPVYFDVFKWLKDFGTGVGNFKYTVLAFGTEFSDACAGNGVLIGINIFLMVIIDIPLLLLKFLGIVLSLIFLLIGGPMYEWALPGGWLYEFIDMPFLFVDQELLTNHSNQWTIIDLPWVIG